MNASSVLLMTLTATATPTPASPPNAAAPAMLRIWRPPLVAATVRPPVEVTMLLAPMNASVVTLITLMPTEPAAPASDPPAPASPHELNWSVAALGACSACTVTPFPAIVSPTGLPELAGAPTVASFTTVAMLSDTPAPTESSLITAVPIPCADELALLVDWTRNAPLPVTVRPSGMLAVLEVVATLMPTAAATPTVAMGLSPSDDVSLPALLMALEVLGAVADAP